MRTAMQSVVVGTSLFLIAFGLACFNFTKPSGLEHHTRVAVENDWPAPSDRIVGLGLFSVVAGTAVAAWTWGRSSARRGSSAERRADHR